MKWRGNDAFDHHRGVAHQAGEPGALGRLHVGGLDGAGPGLGVGGEQGEGGEREECGGHGFLGRERRDRLDPPDIRTGQSIDK